MLAEVVKKNSVENFLGKKLLSTVHTFEDATAQSAGRAFEQMLAGVLERKEFSTCFLGNMENKNIVQTIVGTAAQSAGQAFKWMFSLGNEMVLSFEYRSLHKTSSDGWHLSIAWYCLVNNVIA